jgi:NAD(P)-dependent dehydrogenase (short-subunit alcohol dehydrogenase family)
LISKGSLTRQCLEGECIVVTGAGGGIGYEAARALAWLGARVVIAEIDARRGKAAAEALCREMGAGSVSFIQTDVGDEGSVKRLARDCFRSFGKVDGVVNNATVAPLGGFDEVPIKDWDASYRVNLRGPALLAQSFLPGMIQRDHGVFVCVSSVGGAYMGAYESAKAGQVEFARSLDGELEGKKVIVFTISPGIVPTPTAQAGIAAVAPRYGKTVEEFYEMYRNNYLTVEAAGAGFAAAVALAAQFRGLEIGSVQALVSAGINLEEGARPEKAPVIAVEQIPQALELYREARATFEGQYYDWLKRPLFEKQWMLRDFRQNAGMPGEEFMKDLVRLGDALEQRDVSTVTRFQPLLMKLSGYYKHYLELMESNEKDPAKRKEYGALIRSWQDAAERLAKMLGR